MASLFETIVDAVKVELDKEASGVEFYKFRLAQSEHKDGRFVVWVPLRGQISPPQRMGGKKNEDDTARGTPLYAKLTEVHAFIQAEDFETTVELHDAVLRAVTTVLGAPATVGLFHVHTQETDGAAWMHGGRQVIEHVMQWPLQVLTEPEGDGLVQVISHTHECEIES